MYKTLTYTERLTQGLLEMPGPVPSQLRNAEELGTTNAKVCLVYMYKIYIYDCVKSAQ